MAANPLDDENEAHRLKVQERAYHLWQAEGEPHGRDREYWERARELIAMEESGATGQLPNPSSLPGADPNALEGVEEAFLQENLGEFPDRFADQGEKSATPKAKPRARAAALEATQKDPKPKESKPKDAAKSKSATKPKGA